MNELNQFYILPNGNVAKCVYVDEEKHILSDGINTVELYEIEWLDALYNDVIIPCNPTIH